MNTRRQFIASLAAATATAAIPSSIVPPIISKRELPLSGCATGCYCTEEYYCGWQGHHFEIFGTGYPFPLPGMEKVAAIQLRRDDWSCVT